MINATEVRRSTNDMGEKRRVLCLNLLRKKPKSSDLKLSQFYQSLIEISAEKAKSAYNVEIGYFHYDFHAECHKNTDALEDFVE